MASVKCPLHQTTTKLSVSLKQKKKKSSHIHSALLQLQARLLCLRLNMPLMKAANQSTFFLKHKTTFTSTFLFLPKLDKPAVFVTKADSILSSCLSTCPVGLKWDRMDRKKTGANGNMAAIVQVCLRDSQKRQTSQTGPKESSLNGVCVMCVCIQGAAGMGDVNIFSSECPSPFA